MKIAVAGATGFVGRRITRALVARGDDVIALVRSPARAADLGADVHEWDFSRSARESLVGVDTLCHVAAYLPTSYADPAEARACLEANALGSLTLLESAAEAGVHNAVVFSSGNAYAWLPRAAQEGDAIYPSRRAPYYLVSKLAGEVFADHFQQTGRMRVVVLRPSAVYGPGMSANGVVARFAKALRAGAPVRVDDGGRYSADFVYVDDVVSLALGAMSSEVHGPFNVGSGRRSTTLDVAETLASLLGFDHSFVHVEPERMGTPDQGFAPLDITRATSLLGYRPRSLREGLSAYLASLG